MTATFQIVDSDLTTVLFDLNDSTGAANTGSVQTHSFVGGAFDLGAPDPEFTTVSSPSVAGGRVVYRRDPLVESSWRTRMVASSYDNLVAGVGELGRLLAKGGVLKWIADGSSETRYIDFEPSPQAALLTGDNLEMQRIVRLFTSPEGVTIQVLRQPYLRGAELVPTVNVLTNSTLFGAASSRPLDWAYDSAAAISGESINATHTSYAGTITAGTASLQQTYTGASENDIWTGSIYGKATSGSPGLSVDLIWVNSGGTAIGTATGGTTTLSTSWQRVTNSGTAPANTAKVKLSAKLGTAGTAVYHERYAQLEEASAATAYRTGAETLAFDPADADDLPRVMPVYCQGNAPSPAAVRVKADASLLAKFKVYRETSAPIEVLKATLFKQLEGGDLGANTSGTADANASGGTAAHVAYTASSPALRADSSGGGTGDSFVITKPAGATTGDVLVCAIWRGDETTVISGPNGWKLLGTQTQTTNTFTWKGILYIWYKVADDDDAAATDYSFAAVFPAAPSSASYRYWMGAYQNVDNTTPIDTYDFSTEGNTTAPTADSITTTRNNNMVVTVYAGVRSSAAALTWTAPSGTTPTYTEEDDGTADVNYRGMAVYDGVLATAGATGTKDATAVSAADVAMVNMALNIAPAPIVARSTVTFTGVPAGTYDVWLRFYPTSASRSRIRVEWAPMASPSSWVSLPDYVCDVTGAAAFAYVDRMFGRLYVPEEAALSTLTLRVSAGLEDSASTALRLDFVALAPANEHVGSAAAPVILAENEYVEADADSDKAFHLDSSGNLKGFGTIEGPTPVELEPGLNLLYLHFANVEATGFNDRATVLGAVPTVQVTHSPRYRA